MSTRNWSDPHDRKVFEESIYTPKIEPVRLPDETETVFQEEQPFDQVWLWALMGVELIIVLLPLIITGQPLWAIGLAVGFMVMTFAMLGALKLRTRIDRQGIHYRMSIFHWKEQTIPWEDIDQVYVRKYSPLKEYGGWGVKYGPSGKAFNVKGNFGIQITKKNGKRVLLGTQLPDDVSAYLSQHPLLV